MDMRQNNAEMLSTSSNAEKLAPGLLGQGFGSLFLVLVLVVFVVFHIPGLVFRGCFFYAFGFYGFRGFRFLGSGRFVIRRTGVFTFRFPHCRAKNITQARS